MSKLDPPSRPELFDFHGVSMTHNYTDNWENLQNFQARPEDVLVAAYPRSGNTWLCCILDLLYFGEMFPERQASIPIFRRVPLLEATFPWRAEPGATPHVVRGTDMVEKLPTSPRLIKTHLPVQFIPKSFWEQNCRIVYSARNSKDNVVSYFHLERMTTLLPEPGDWSSYLQRFMEGKMLFGPWYNHVNGWWKKKQSPSNIHYVFYEDLVEDTGREIDKLCSFLGLSPSAEGKEKILNRVQFDKMKSDNMVNHSVVREMDFKVSSFIRKGKVGDWKNHFTVAQNEVFEEDYKKKMKEETLQFRSEI